MKQKILFIAALAALMISCKNANNFSLEGTINAELSNDFEGSKAALLYRQQKQWHTFDSAYIADGKFKIEAKVEKPVVAILTIDDIEMGEVVCEPGQAVCRIAEDGTFHCEGTPNNDLIKDFSEKIQTVESEEEFIGFFYDFVLNNINNAVGQYLFCSNYIMLNMQQIDAVIAQMDETTKQDEEVHFILDKIEVMRRSSEGHPFLDITLQTPAGEKLSIGQLVGKNDYLLIDFWASWCGPCRRAMPQMIELYNQFNPTGDLDILGISLDNDSAAWTGAIESLGLKWHHISDLAGWQSAAAGLYGVSAIPSTLLINKEGIIVARNLEPEAYKDIISNKK